MKKILLSLIVFSFLFTTPLIAQPFEDIPTALEGLGRSFVAWGDYDNDGDLDLAICGEKTDGIYASLVYRNDEGLFVDAGANLKGVKDGSMEWGDYDRDGDLDLLLTGETYDEGNIALIYRNDEGVFTEYDAGFPGVGYGHGAWGDFDNDGDLDALITGNWTVELFENDGGSFSLVEEDFGHLQNSRASWGDFDNDGDLDLLLIGDTGGGYLSVVYRNDQGSFTMLDLGMVGVFSGTADWIDYDNDGDLDISITGFDIFLEPLFLVYTNNGDGSVDSLSHDMEGVSTSGVDWGDYDNDGDLDVVMSGKTGCCGGNATKIYRNDPDGFNEELNAGISGAIRAAVAWADYDNDGDLDFILAGMTPAEVPYTKMILNAAGNNDFTPNSLPTSPEALESEVNGSAVSLSWDASQDNETPAMGLNYNLRIGTYPGGQDILPAMASGEDGYRYVQAMGNAGNQLQRSIFQLPEGTYYWSVQAIDQAYCGSAFAGEQSFTILATGVDELAAFPEVNVYPNPASDKLTLNAPSSEAYEIKIYDMSGRNVYSGRLMSGEKIDVSSWENGMYVMQMSSGNKKFSTGIVKE